MWQYNYTSSPDELYHHGILGMKWGRRRYQNPDGSLTPAGKKRYAKLEGKLNKNIERQTKFDDKVLKSRTKTRDKIASKYDKQLERVTDNSRLRKNIQARKDADLEDFDIGTDAIKKAQKIGNENANRVVELKMQAVSDPSILQSKSYKQAKQWCSAQAKSEAVYGKPLTVVYEARAVLAGKSWTRKNLELED